MVAKTWQAQILPPWVLNTFQGYQKYSVNTHPISAGADQFCYESLTIMATYAAAVFLAQRANLSRTP